MFAFCVIFTLSIILMCLVIVPSFKKHQISKISNIKTSETGAPMAPSACPKPPCPAPRPAPRIASLERDENVYKIVSIADECTVVVNYGRQNGATVGDILKIVADGREIFDPDTHESLGFLTYAKETVEVINVYKEMSICQPLKKDSSNRASEETNFFTPLLSVNQDQITGWGKRDFLIKIGDLVEVISTKIKVEVKKR